MTKTEIELLKELGYSPMQIFNLRDEEVKKILANATLERARPPRARDENTFFEAR